MANNESWIKIFNDYNIDKHDFEKDGPFKITAGDIKSSCQNFTSTAQKEVRILCKQDSRTDRPSNFIDKGLFILPIVNGQYIIIKGEGYIDIPEITTGLINYNSKLDFILDSSKVGNSEMQHLDFAYASSLIRTFMDDKSLVLTIRGRKYTPEFSFNVGNNKVIVKSVQTEVDAGYEGRDKIVLVEAKNSKTTNTIIRQLFYPYKQWKQYTNKDIYLIFFERRDAEFHIWQYSFKNDYDYNSISLVKSERYLINT
jgi:hypothetical protein